MALSLLVLSAGCQREEVVSVDQDNDVMEVYATIEDVDDVQIRTYLSGTDVYWSSGDKIAVFLGNTLRKRFDVTPESIDSKDATFEYDSQYIITGNNSDISHNISYYPFCNVTCAPDGSSYTLDNLTLPETQTYVSGSVGLGAFPMVAVTENTDDVNFRFKNICGVMQFQLTGYGYVKSVSVKGNNEEVLSGPAVVTAGYGKEPSIAMSAEGGKIVTLDCGEGGVELNGTTPVSFFIVLPPVQFEGGFTITVTDTWGGRKEYSTTKKNPVGRSKGLRMPSKEYIGVRPPQEGDYIDEYGVNHGQGIEIDGVVWAPVNCGYKAPTADSKGFPYGKLYQWGRKYGQGYDESDEIVPEISEGPVSLDVGQSEGNKNKFYSRSKNPYHWLQRSNNLLWNSGTESSPEKTLYNPCPDGWRVPTYVEMEKLKKNHSSFTENNLGQAGYWCTGSNVYSENVPKIFLPAAGQLEREGTPGYRDRNGFYWSSKSAGSVADNLFFSKFSMSCASSMCAYGLSVRCVQDDSEVVAVENISLNMSNITLEVGAEKTLIATVIPATTNPKVVSWWSSDESVAVVDLDGNVTAISEGTATITVKAGIWTATCRVAVVVVKDYIDEDNQNWGKGILIGDVVWAPVNCGYKAPTADSKGFPYGKLYQWGRKYGQGYDEDVYTTLEVGGVSIDIASQESKENVFYTSTSEYNYDWVYPEDDELWDLVKTEYDPCPSGWRVPRSSELRNLCINKSSWTTNDSGYTGYWFSGKNAYTTEVPQVFFPAAGYRFHNGNASGRGSKGAYWSSTSSTSTSTSSHLYFTSASVSEIGISRALGHSVRCVQE